MSKKLSLIVFLVIVGIASFLRFYKLGNVPVSLYWDETAMMVDAMSISTTGKDINGGSIFQSIFLSYGDYKMPVYILLTSLFFKLFGPSEALLRLPSALSGLGSLIVIYYLTKNLFNLDKNKKIISLLSMLVIAISPWSIMFSRTGFEGHIGQFFLGLAVLICLIGVKNKKYLLILLSQLIAITATYSYFSVRFIWPVIFVLIIILFNKIIPKSLDKKIIFKNIFKYLFLPLFFYLFLLLPMVRSPLYAQSNIFRLSTASVLNVKEWPVESNDYKELAGNKLIDRFLYYPKFLIFRELAKNYSDNLSLDYLFISGDPNLRHGTTQHGLFLLVLAPFLFVGLYQILKKYPKQAILLICWWLVALLPASVPESTPHALRSLNALIPISLIIGFGLAQIKFNKKYLIILTLLLAINLLQFSNHYFKYYPAQSAEYFQDGYKQLAKMINKYNIETRTVWVTPFDDRFFLWPMTYGSLNNIEYAQFDYKKLSNLNHKIILVGQQENLKEIINKYNLKPTWQDFSTDSFGNTKFMLVGLGS